jgi:hypothetical protein
MTFLHLSLLGGSALVAVPVLLHLLMRQKPKLLEFPALRFLQRRRDTNQRRLRLRHLLLLALRAAAIVLLALALARPSLQSGGRLSGMAGSQESPVAAALVFDTAPHMEYRQKETRLEAARDLGLRLLAQLPPESQTAVLDTGIVERGFDADRGLSRERIERLRANGASQPVVRVVGQAARLLAQSDLPRKEIYVFTDLSRSAWPSEAAAALQDRLSEVPGVSLYVIDVGVAEPVNFSLGEIHLSQQVLSVGGSVELAASVSCLGSEGQRTVELEMYAAGEKAQKRREQTVSLRPGQARTIDFRLGPLEEGAHQGVVRILGQDGLADDDVRYFSVEVHPAWPLLVAAGRPVQEHAVYLIGAVAPPEMRKRGQAQFDAKLIEFKDLSAQSLESLKSFAAVCLLDPPPLPPAVWQNLTDYVSEGHALAIFLGRHAQPVDSFNAPVAQQLLPGRLNAQVPRREGDNYLAPRDFQHPILKAFAPRATSTPWLAFPVFRYWDLIDAPPGVATVLPYTDGRPALVERPVGSGRVLLLTTPISDPPSRDTWNLLAVGPSVQPWPFVILVRQMMTYLVGGSQQQLNYYAGETVTLPLDEHGRRSTYVLTAPNGTKTTLTPQRQNLTINYAEQVGNYRVQGGGRTSGPDRGFSVNLAGQQTELARVDEKHLAELFGPFTFRVARTADQIDRSVSLGRVGRELYPLLLYVLVAVLALEYVVANRFYGIRPRWGNEVPSPSGRGLE